MWINNFGCFFLLIVWWLGLYASIYGTQNTEINIFLFIGAKN